MREKRLRLSDFRHPLLCGVLDLWYLDRTKSKVIERFDLGSIGFFFGTIISASYARFGGSSFAIALFLFVSPLVAYLPYAWVWYGRGRRYVEQVAGEEFICVGIRDEFRLLISDNDLFILTSHMRTVKPWDRVIVHGIEFGGTSYDPKFAYTKIGVGNAENNPLDGPEGDKFLGYLYNCLPVAGKRTAFRRQRALPSSPSQ